MHVRKTGPQLGDVGADERIGHQIDMVGDDHQVARTERRIDAARSVRHEQAADSQLFEHPHGEGHLLHGVALVVVEPALHGHDAAAVDPAENQAPLVPLDRRNGEIGNILVLDRVLHLDIVGEIAQTRTENDPHLGGKLPDLRTDECGGLKNLI